MDAREAQKKTKEGLTMFDQVQIFFRCLTRRRMSGASKKLIAYAFCTFKDDRVRLSENYLRGTQSIQWSLRDCHGSVQFMHSRPA